jgi:hypothetical protein
MYDMVHYVNYGTVLYRAVQCHTVLYSVVLYNVFLFSLTLLSLLQLAVWQTVEGWPVGIVKRCFIFYTLLFSQCVQRKKVNIKLEAKAPLRCRLS